MNNALPSKEDVRKAVSTHTGNIPVGCGSFGKPVNAPVFVFEWESPEGDKYTSDIYVNQEGFHYNWEKIKDSYFDGFYATLIRHYEKKSTLIL